mmetsp:Transcript_98896/g.235911  ORF Transcript_98896/g.235911 Transcript_98896/m.235911 type:complete len:372 (+) Transcript_98896:1820-2935(+)
MASASFPGAAAFSAEALATRQRHCASSSLSPRLLARASASCARGNALPPIVSWACAKVHSTCSSRILSPTCRESFKASPPRKMQSSVLSLPICARAMEWIAAAWPLTWPISLKVFSAWLAACSAPKASCPKLAADTARSALPSPSKRFSSRKVARACLESFKASSSCGFSISSCAKVAFTSAAAFCRASETFFGASAAAFRAASSSGLQLLRSATVTGVNFSVQVRPSSLAPSRASFSALAASPPALPATVFAKSAALAQGPVAPPAPPAASSAAASLHVAPRPRSASKKSAPEATLKRWAVAAMMAPATSIIFRPLALPFACKSLPSFWASSGFLLAKCSWACAQAFAASPTGAMADRCLTELRPSQGEA